MPICGAALPDIPVGGGAAVAAPAPGLVGVPPLALLLVPARALRALGRAPLRPLGGDAGQPRALLLLVTVQALNTNITFSHLYGSASPYTSHRSVGRGGELASGGSTSACWCRTARAPTRPRCSPHSPGRTARTPPPPPAGRCTADPRSCPRLECGSAPSDPACRWRCSRPTAIRRFVINPWPTVRSVSLTALQRLHLQSTGHSGTAPGFSSLCPDGGLQPFRGHGEYSYTIFADSQPIPPFCKQVQELKH